MYLYGYHSCAPVPSLNIFMIKRILYGRAELRVLKKENTNELPNQFNLIVFWCESFLYVAMATVIFSQFSPESLPGISLVFI